MIKNALILYLRMILVLIISLYSSRVVLNILGVEDFGIYNVVGSIVLMLAFLNNTMAGSTQRYFSYEIGRGLECNLSTLFSVSLIIYLMFSFVAVLLLELGGLFLIKNYLVIPKDRLFQAEVAFHISLATFILYVIRTPFISLMIAYERMLIYSFINVGDVFLKLIFILLIPFTNIGNIVAYATALLIATFIVTFIIIIYFFVEFKNISFILVKDKEHYKGVTSFAGWSSLTSIANMAIEQGLNILINMFFGPVLNAARSISLQIKIQISSFISNIQLAVSPQIIKKYASGNTKAAHELVFVTSKLFFFCSLVICLPFVFFSDQILNVWLGVVPPYASVFTSLLVINLLIDSFSGNIPVAIQAGGKIKAFQIVQGVILMLAVPVSYLLFRSGYSVYTSVYVTIFLSVLCVVARVYFYSKLMDVRYSYFFGKVFFRNILSGLLLSFCFYIIEWLWSRGFITALFLFIFISIFYVIFVFLFVVLNSFERNVFKQLVTSRLKFRSCFFK